MPVCFLVGERKKECEFGWVGGGEDLGGVAGGGNNQNTLFK